MRVDAEIGLLDDYAIGNKLTRRRLVFCEIDFVPVCFGVFHRLSLGRGVIIGRVLALITLILAISLFCLAFDCLSVVLTTLWSNGLTPLDEISQICDLILFIFHLRTLY